MRCSPLAANTGATSSRVIPEGSNEIMRLIVSRAILGN
jgi:alkylation response protein AidB-like acyl-CoA dehydrogenase